MAQYLAIIPAQRGLRASRNMYIYQNFLFRHFFVTFQREWVGVDNFRMDKYMMLVRRFIRAIFTYWNEMKWKRISDLNQLITELFEPKEAKACLGFQMHVTDVYLEELAKVTQGTIADKHIRVLLKPFITKISDPTVHKSFEALFTQHIFCINNFFHRSTFLLKNRFKRGYLSI